MTNGACSLRVLGRLYLDIVRTSIAGGIRGGLVGML